MDPVSNTEYPCYQQGVDNSYAWLAKSSSFSCAMLAHGATKLKGLVLCIVILIRNFVKMAHEIHHFSIQFLL